MLRGRKVSNPTVSTGGGSSRHEGDKDLNRAWSNIHKVKTELRKIEHRLGESEHRAVLNEIYETRINDYSPLTDLNVTYDATESGRAAFVDRHGWAPNVRNKSYPNSRKISRIEDKYQEMDGAGARSRMDKNDGKGTTHGKSGKSSTDALSNGGRDRKYKASKSEQTRDSSPQCLENADGIYGDLVGATGVTNDLNSLDHDPSLINQDTLTDSRAIRETNIRFLNDNLTAYDDVRWGRAGNPSNPNHLAHVSVTVPRGRDSYHHEPYPARATHLNQEERERKWEVGSTDSAASDTSSQMGRKLKKTLKDLDFDALSKIKEKIRKQQQRSASPKVDILNNNGDEEDAPERDMNGPLHHLHNECEPVLGRAAYDLPPPDGADSQRRVRKVAAGPTVPSYKGFSEAEVKYKYADFKPPKVMDWRKREKKKKAALKLQEKKIEQAIKEAVPEDQKPKLKKLTRIVASGNKKPEKQSKKDIITTSSWRAGQEVILRELGPAKTRRTSQTSEASIDVRPQTTGANNHDNELDKLEDMTEPRSATALELERAKALSEEARKVLSDLNMGSENEDDERRGKENEENIKRRRSTKRKASKTTEPEKQSNAKQRHYDQEEVRRFMQKQKADRMRQQREEEKRKQRAIEMRSQQLEELRSKQKQSAQPSKRPSKSAGARGKYKVQDETFTHSQLTYKDLPRHHPFHEDLQSGSLATTDSERERHAGIPPREEEEMSDDSSTLTGESLEAVTPTITPRVEFEDVQGKPKSSSHERNSVLDGNLNSANVKNLGGLTFNVDGVLNKFSEALHSRGNDINSGYGGSVSSTGSQDRPHVYGSEDPGTRSKADRIQAIMNTAATLQQKIQVETSKITGEKPELYKRRALPQSSDEEDFVTRYERLTGAQQDFSVFSSNLPGQQRISRDSGPTEENTIETAAIRIQAAYRGHTVRQSLNWKLPSGNSVKTSHRRGMHEEDDTITETDTISVTVTEDSEDESLTHRKIGTGLQERDFHAGSRSRPPTDDFVIPRPTHSAQSNRYSWESPSPDPYNVLSIFARHQKNQAGRPRSSAIEMQVQQRTSVKEDFHAEPSHSQHSIPSKSTKVTSNFRTQSPAGGRNSTSVKAYSGAGSVRNETSQPVSGSQRNVYKSRNDATLSKVSGYSASAGESHDSDEDTIEGDSYSQSFESDEEKRSGIVSKLVSEKSSMKSGYRARSSKPTSVVPDGNLSVEEESPSVSHGRVSPPGEESASRNSPPRMSPNALERKFYLELNQLESMEESMRQLTGMERTRAVSMAQQETVSLAQMLKARQQAHEKDMKVLESKAQLEAMEAMSELQSARLRGTAASQGAEEILTRLGSRQSNAQPLDSSDNIRPRKASKQSVSHPAESARSATHSYTQPTTHTVSDTSTRSQSSVEGVKTASDTQREADSESSIRSISKAEGKDDSLKEDSVSEELEDYTLDETMTEDEMERSFRSILPSESHRKRAKKQLDNVSVTSDEGSVSAPATPRYSMDDLGSFIGEDSFNKFTEEMVKQFMKEEELRAQHQASLLQLREKALMEKTKAELSWLEQQKQRIRNKGADDTYPQIIKRQRGLKMRLQEQQAEIKRLQEQNKAASRERQMILQQHEEISRLRNQTQKTKNKLGGRLGRPSEVHTEDEVSAFDDHSDAGVERHPKKDYKSDSEIYTEPKNVNKKGKADNKTMEKIKKIHLDEKYLTVREQRLHDRRRNVEDLLKWKKRLDEEEEKIYKMEQTALKIWDGDNKKDAKASTPETVPKEKPKTATRKDKKESQTYSSIQEDSFVSEVITTAKDDSVKKSVTDSPKTELVNSVESSPEETKLVASERGAKYKTNLGRSASESSIPEEVLSQYSLDESPMSPNRRGKSTAAESTALNDSYADNTFVDESTMATSRDKVSRKSPRSPLDQLTRQKINFPLTGRDLKPRRHGNRGRSSESESEESISHTDVSTYTETQSDLSDFEGRVRALTEELKRRKIQADKLKKERKKRRRDILKNKEEALKKQIEALDNQIDQLKTEIHHTTDREPAKVKPQILKPRVSPVKKSPEATSPKVINTDDSGTESTQSSPSVIEDKDSKPSSPVSKSTPVSSRIPAPLDRISEGSESSRSRSVRNKEDSSMTEEIETAADDSSVSGYLKIPKSPVSEKQPTYKEEDSYSMDFERTASLAGPPSEKPPVSARSTEISHSKPAFNDQISEAISAVCSEHIDDSVRSDSFVKPLDLKNDQEELYSPRSSVTVSRPSSEKSERSYASRSTDLESASESEQVSVGPSDQPEQQMREESVIDSIIDVAQNTEDESEQYPVFKTTNKAQEEEDTPINSPRESSDFSQIDDPMSDFNIGDRVLVTTSDRMRRRGQLLFKGKVHFAPGIWAGVELDHQEGKTDGMEDGKRYFSCKPGHGIFVPGNDLMPAPTPTPRSTSHVSVGSITDESEEEQEIVEEQEDLSKLISEADLNVREFDTTKEDQNKLTDLITDQILEKVVSDECDVMADISDRKTPPPVAPKPKRTPEVVQENTENQGQTMVNGHLSPPESDNEKSSPIQKKIEMSNKVVDNLLDDALTKMLKISKKKRNQNNNLKVTQDLLDLSTSPTKELMEVLSREEDEEDEEDVNNVPPRPSSPMPGSTPQNSQRKMLDDDINALFDSGLEEELFSGLTPSKAPPPYPGTPEPKLEMQKLAEEVRVAVPHTSDQVRRIVASAVEIHFQHRTNGAPINGQEPPESYFTASQENSEDEGLESSSQRVYKKLLYDLTGELMKEIYKDEQKEEPPPWRKPKQRRQKYFRGASPPGQLDALTPIVQEAVIDMLGLNGSRKLDRNKWNVRKKKDHVDNILVQELREEEPEWVNYDDDEVAVKMQLTDTIFETLLTDTVQVMSKIYQKRRSNVHN